MALKLTKNEQKKQKDALKAYQRFLPTLLLKKKQLQSVIKSYKDESIRCTNELAMLKNDISSWIAVYNENRFFEKEKIQDYIQKDSVICTSENIAGVVIPVFKELTFKDIKYDLSSFPLWVDKGIQAMKDAISKTAEAQVINRAVFLLERELAVTSQRVNLFEKVKIPETKSNIKKISIALGDQATSSVVRGKISQRKLSVGV